MSICNDDHSGDLPADFNKIPASQAARWRHKCAGCAYELGRKHAQDAEERLRERVRHLTSEVQKLGKKGS
jgi:hypothetical protein